MFHSGDMASYLKCAHENWPKLAEIESCSPGRILDIKGKEVFKTTKLTFLSKNVAVSGNFDKKNGQKEI